MKDDNLIKTAFGFAIFIVLFYMSIIVGAGYLIYRVLEHQNWI